MFATVRRYVGLPEPVVERLLAVAPGLGELLTSAPGFCDCRLIRTREGLLVVLTGSDEVSLMEAGRRFVAWAGMTVEGFSGAANPEIWTGDLAVAGSIAPLDHHVEGIGVGGNVK